MASTTVRISERSHRALKTLAEETGHSMQETLENAIEQERRRRIFDEADAAYARMRADAAASSDYEAELASLEGTMSDGLETEPPYPAARRAGRRSPASSAERKTAETNRRTVKSRPPKK